MSGYDPGYLGIFRELTAPDPTDQVRYQRANRQPGPSAMPEGRLWMQVLENAIVDILRPNRGSLHYDALHWIKQGAAEHVGSFKFVCQTLGLDPQAVQRRLLEALEARGGSNAVIPLREPKNSIARQPRSHHRGRIARKVLVCREMTKTILGPTDRTAPDADNGDRATRQTAVCR